VPPHASQPASSARLKPAQSAVGGGGGCSPPGGRAGAGHLCAQLAEVRELAERVVEWRHRCCGQPADPPRARTHDGGARQYVGDGGDGGDNCARACKQQPSPFLMVTAGAGSSVLGGVGRSSVPSCLALVSCAGTHTHTHRAPMRPDRKASHARVRAPQPRVPALLAGWAAHLQLRADVGHRVVTVQVVVGAGVTVAGRGGHRAGWPAGRWRGAGGAIV
jgi:hypothetical protein